MFVVRPFRHVSWRQARKRWGSRGPEADISPKAFYCPTQTDVDEPASGKQLISVQQQSGRFFAVAKACDRIGGGGRFTLERACKPRPKISMAESLSYQGR